MVKPLKNQLISYGIYTLENYRAKFNIERWNSYKIV